MTRTAGIRGPARILIAEDDAVSRRVLEALLLKWGFEVEVCTNGAEALLALRKKDAPQLAILDGMMPMFSGTDVCKRIRALSSETPPYLILLTAMSQKEDVMEGFHAGADDYVRKPFDQDELHARLRVGLRVIALRQQLAGHVAQANHENNRLKVLLQIAENNSSFGSLRDLLRAIHQGLGVLLDTKNFYVALYDERRQVYEFPYSVDEFDGTDFAPQQLKRSLTDYVRRTGTPLLADEAMHHELVQQGEVDLVGAPSKVWLGAPLRTTRGVIGVVALQSYANARAYSEKELDLLALVSGNIGTAIERQQSYQKLRESEDRYRNLVEKSGLWACPNDVERKAQSAGGRELPDGQRASMESVPRYS